jgi:branched-chain amino acid transport system substrate-binding protein
MFKTLSVALLAAVPVLTGATAHAEDFTIGALESLTNAYAFVGVPLTNGAKLAVDDINASGMLGAGNKLVLIAEDGASDRAQALTLTNKFAGDPKVLALLGPTSTIDVLATGMIANQTHVAQMTNSPAPDTLKLGPYTFRISVATPEYMTQLADYFFDKTHDMNCAFVTVSNNVGYLLQRDLVKEDLVKRGGKVLADELVAATDSDFSAISTKIIALQPNCLAVNAPAEQTANVIVQMKQAGLPSSVGIVLHNTAASNAFLKAGGKAVEGVYLVSEFSPPGLTPEARQFSDAYAKRFGAAPDNWGALGYSSVQLIADAIRRSLPNPTRDKVRDAINATKNLHVVAGEGILSVGEDRNTHYKMTILTVKDGKFVPPQ